jgi:chromosome segregation protein
MLSRREAQSRELAVIDERKKSLTALNRDTNSDIARIEETLGKERGREKIVLGEISQKESELAEARAHLSQAQQVLIDRQQEYAKYEGELQIARDKVSTLSLQQGELQVLHAERIIQLEQDEKSIQSTDESYTAAEKSLREAEAKLDSVRKKQEEIKDALQNADTALQLHREKVGEIDNQLTNAHSRRSLFESKVARISAQLEVMDQADASLSGYAEGTRILLQAARNTDLKGILGGLNAQINVPVELEIAITAALGDFLDAVVLENKTSDALNLLREQGTRGVLLPRNSIKEAPRLSIKGIKKELNLIGIASELVDCTPDIRPIINLLLGRALVVENRMSAQKLLEHITNVDHQLGNGKDTLDDVRVVTLTGEVYFASGPVLTSGVQSEPEHLTLLSRSRRQQELREQKQETVEDVAGLVQHIDKFREEHERLSGEGKRITQELDEEKTRYEQAILAGEKARAEV